VIDLTRENKFKFRGSLEEASRHLERALSLDQGAAGGERGEGGGGWRDLAEAYARIQQVMEGLREAEEALVRGEVEEAREMVGVIGRLMYSPAVTLASARVNVAAGVQKKRRRRRKRFLYRACMHTHTDE
jgi:hypothetical protein